MTRARPAPLMRCAISACLAAILVLSLGLGTVVQASAIAQASGPSSSLTDEYRLPDGTLPVLCSGAGQKGDRQDPGGHCFLCTFAKIAGLPPMPAHVPAHVVWRRLPGVPGISVSPPSCTTAAFRARAPPVFP